MPEAAAGQAPVGETAPAPAVAAVVAVQAPQVTDVDAGGTGVEPLLSRLKAAGASGNDIEQVERYYGGYDETRTLKGKVGELEGKDTLRDYADQLMGQLDAGLQTSHKGWRQTYGDAAYVELRLKQESRDAGDAPAESDEDRMARMVKEQVASALAPVHEEREREARHKALNADLTKILEGMTLGDKVKKFLLEDISGNIDGYIATHGDIELADLVQQRHTAVSGLLESTAAATKVPLTPVTPEAPAPAGSAKDAAEGEPQTSDEIIDSVFAEVSASEERGAGAG